MLAKALRRFFGLSSFDRLYERIAERIGQTTFSQTAVEVLRFEIDLPPDQRRRIPAEGPLVVVANHPSGAMEGLALPAILESIRSDVRTLSHVWFGSYPELARGMFLIDPAAREHAFGSNKSVLHDAARWVREGGALLVFPAGEVARFDWEKRKVADLPWRPGVARTLRAARATVLPVHVEARNSLLFHLLSLIHRRLAALWLIRELLSKVGTTLHVRIGRPIPYEELPATSDNGELASHLQDAVENLNERETVQTACGTAQRSAAVGP